MPGVDNNSLCDRLRKGDKKSLDEIFALYAPKISRFAYSYLKDEEGAMDIVQEVFIKLWECRKSLQSGTKLEAFIYSVAKNTVLSLFRKKSTEAKYLTYLENSIVSNNSGVEEVTDFNFLQEQYLKLLPKIPFERRSIFLMSREEGLSNKEIAERKGISVKTVENQMTKALAFLKKHLGNAGWMGLLYYYIIIS